MCTPPPELPEATIARLEGGLRLARALAEAVVAEHGAVAYLEAAVEEGAEDAEAAAKLVVRDVAGQARAAGHTLARHPESASPRRVAQVGCWPGPAPSCGR
jgi:Asp-tRNA(Asn)/Glu-tRNA(Gln) amidotransferase B subunit